MYLAKIDRLGIMLFYSSSTKKVNQASITFLFFRTVSTEKLKEDEDEQKVEASDEKMAISVIGSSSLDAKKETRDPRKKSEPIKLLPAGMSKKPTRTRTFPSSWSWEHLC